jgi:hypothetical protein
MTELEPDVEQQEEYIELTYHSPLQANRFTVSYTELFDKTAFLMTDHLQIYSRQKPLSPTLDFVIVN